MTKKILLLALMFGSKGLFAQDMTFKDLKLILAQKATLVQESGPTISYSYRDLNVYLIADETNNRMRLMTGITEEKNLKKEDLEILLRANFDRALDAKYALSEGVLWSVFAHPLRELRKEQLEDALDQVVNLVYTYGTSYSSTSMVFGGGE